MLLQCEPPTPALVFGKAKYDHTSTGVLAIHMEYQAGAQTGGLAWASSGILLLFGFWMELINRWKTFLSASLSFCLSNTENLNVQISKLSTHTSESESLELGARIYLWLLIKKHIH